MRCVRLWRGVPLQTPALVLDCNSHIEFGNDVDWYAQRPQILLPSLARSSSHRCLIG